MDRRWGSRGHQQGHPFPPSDIVSEDPNGADQIFTESFLEDFENYDSMQEYEVEASEEFTRMMQQKYAIDMPVSFWRTLKAGHVNRMSIIVKVRRDGVKKIRIVIDMRRSGANRKARIPERPVLPRPCDAVADGLAVMRDRLPRLKPRPGTTHHDTGDEWGMEQVTGDFGDAYMHLAVHHKELRHCLVRKPTRIRHTKPSHKLKKKAQQNKWQDYCVLPMVCFGSRSAPLTWSRLAAAISRLGAAVLVVKKGRLQVYLDDPMITI